MRTLAGNGNNVNDADLRANVRVQLLIKDIIIHGKMQGLNRGLNRENMNVEPWQREFWSVC
jgi:hypothetical protein